MTDTTFIFDVDGTLTPSRGQMDPEFQEFFVKYLMSRHDVYLVTGSDYPKTVEQVGQHICENVKAVFNCSGNHIWKNGEVTYESDWSLPDHMIEWLEVELNNSTFPLRTGKHFEQRIGLFNFSIVGRNAHLAERKMYKDFDKSFEERETIARFFNENFITEGVIAQVAGETGLDIMPVGCMKDQVLEYLPEKNITFFGDKMQEGGNDYPLKKAIEAEVQNGAAIEVQNWKDTYEILQIMVYNS